MNKMARKYLFVIVMFFLIVFRLFSIENVDLLKRTIVILPFYNQEKTEKYDYLSDIICHDLTGKLGKSFNFVDYDETKMIIRKMGYDEKSSIIEGNAKKIALRLEADIVVFGDYIIQNKEIIFSLKSFDVIIEKVITQGYKRIRTGYNFSRYLNEFTQETSLEIIERFTTFDKRIIDVCRSKKNVDKDKRALIENLLNQRNAYWNISIKLNKYKKMVKIPFLKYVVFFVNLQENDFTVEYNGIKTNFKSKIGMFVFDTQVGKKRQFKIISKDSKSIIKTCVQAKDYEVNFFYIQSKAEKESENYRMFIDNSINSTTSGYIGYSFKLGLGLPMKSKLKNNIYLRFFVAPKVINVINIDETPTLYYPHLKLRVGIGYEHVFYVKKALGIHVGFEVGYGLRFFSFLVKDTQKVDLDEMICGSPSIYYSMPFAIQFFANRKYNFIIGIEPTLRLVINSFIRDNILWFEALDGTRGLGLEMFRQQIDNYLILDLFFYDMPIIFCLRIRI